MLSNCKKAIITIISLAVIAAIVLVSLQFTGKINLTNLRGSSNNSNAVINNNNSAVILPSSSSSTSTTTNSPSIAATTSGGCPPNTLYIPPNSGNVDNNHLYCPPCPSGFYSLGGFAKTCTFGTGPTNVPGIQNHP